MARPSAVSCPLPPSSAAAAGAESKHVQLHRKQLAQPVIVRVK